MSNRQYNDILVNKKIFKLGEKQFNVEDPVTIAKSLSIGHSSKGKGEPFAFPLINAFFFAFTLVNVFFFAFPLVNVQKTLSGLVRKASVGEKPLVHESKSKPVQPPHPHH